MTEALLFPKIRIVLVETSHPGNVGAAARAMKNMGLTRLYLVSPSEFQSPQSTFRAVSAADVLEGAVVCSSLEDAISECELVIGTSARERKIPWPMIDPVMCANKALQMSDIGAETAIVFGREDRGLKNEELQNCHYHVNIPTGDAYSSLNLAMAVQVICYEIVNQSGRELSKENWDQPLASAEDLSHFFRHLEETLVQVGFHDPDNPRQLIARLRRLFLRIQPDQMEMNILRGFLTAINQIAVKQGDQAVFDQRVE